MVAKNYYYTDLEEAKKIIKTTINSYDNDKSLNELEDFFTENAELTYEEFYSLFNNKYGWLIKNYRERKKTESLNTIKIAATIQIIAFVFSIIYLFFYLVANA